MSDLVTPDGDQDAGELERRTLAEVLGAVQQTPVPLQNPALLPLGQLDPEVLERLAAELVWRRNNRGAHFYGRRGQAQYGLDIVELEPHATCSLYQVKRFQVMSASQMASVVD